MDDLFAWASKRPDWQQDALCRLTEQRELSDGDLDELQTRIEQANGLPVTVLPGVLRTLRKEHLRKDVAEAPTTILGSIGPVKNIDRLASDQNPLQFAINGITLVYGPTGSGKSGYCRIAKSLCRSLHDAPLRGNAFAAEDGRPPEVQVSFRVAGDEKKCATTWRQPNPPPPELARISVFDTHAAGLYVDEDRNIEFLPFELDLLNRLAQVVLNLEERFKARETTLQAALKTPLPTGYTDGTEVSTTLAKLTQATTVKDLPTEKYLRDLAAWSPENEGRLNTLSDELKNDPGALATARRRMKSTIETIAAETAAMVKTLSEEAIEELKEKSKDAVTKRVTAQASGKDLFKAEPISDLGAEPWRQMMKYAREFAAEAYPDRDPPRIANGDVCVLCQQEVKPEARDRLARFDAYIEGRANMDAETAEAEMEQVLKVLTALTVRKAQDVEGLLSQFRDLDAGRNALAATIASFFDTGRKRHAAVLRAKETGEYENIGYLEPLPDLSAETMAAEVALLSSEAEAYDKQKQDDGQREKLRFEHKNLTDRKRLSTGIEIIVDRRNKLEELKRLLACKAACSTTGVTQQITKLRRETLTPSLQKNLAKEVEVFDLHHLPLKLDDRGKQGESKVKIGLGAARRIGKNSEILSEGEQRALALAGFFAELKEIGSTHGIAVDDPVSSLDHSRMEAVAKRLVEEAASGRQVIIFTHNLTFHYAVTSEALRAGVPLRTEWIARQGTDLFGIIDDTNRPWLAMTVNQRLAKIESEIASLGRTYNHDEETHRLAVRTVYTMMRETWERIVEEILFAGVIDRFRPEVMTLRLRAAHVEQDDYKTVHEGMATCSRYSGHDQAKETSPSLPTFTTIRTDFDSLKTYANKAKDRKTKLEKEGKVFEAAPPIAEIL